MTFIVFRMLSGEQVMATLDGEDHSFLHVSHPLVVKMTPVIENGHMVERITAQPFCQFSADKFYDIPKTSIVFVKQLHRVLVPHYLRIVESYNETVLAQMPDNGGLHWDDEEEEQEETIDDFKKRIDALAEFMEATSEEEPKEEEPVIIKGNKTIH